MRKIYTAITITLFALSSFANQGIGTEFISSSVQAQVSETLGTDFLEFTITDQVTSTIDAVGHTVMVTMPAGTDVTALIADFTLSTGATAWVGGVQVSSTVDALDYSAAVTYTVKNGTESQDWVVTVENEATATVNVTFNVDMKDRQRAFDLAFDAATDEVVVTGNFADWSTPGEGASLYLTDEDGDLIYTGTAAVAANYGDLNYKYAINRGGWAGEEWAGGVHADRLIVIADVDYVVDPADLFGWDPLAVQDKGLSLVSMYPNPVNGQLNIANLDGVSKVTVSNLLGQALVSKNVSDATMTINTAEFKAGIYVVTLVSKNGSTRSERIVKE